MNQVRVKVIPVGPTFASKLGLISFQNLGQNLSNFGRTSSLRPNRNPDPFWDDGYALTCPPQKKKLKKYLNFCATCQLFGIAAMKEKNLL